MSTEQDVDLLYEIGTLRHVMRTWAQFNGGSFANVAEHSLRVAWIAMIIATREHADIGRAVCMALAHDLGETRTGDSNYLTRMYVSHNEHDAMKHTLAGTSVEDSVLSLWREYEERESLEAKIVKDADNLDCDCDLAEESSRGNNIGRALAPTREAVFKKLNTSAARELFEVLQHSDPHGWHITGRNRLTEGDWKVTAPPVQRHLDFNNNEAAGGRIGDDRLPK